MIAAFNRAVGAGLSWQRVVAHRCWPSRMVPRGERFGGLHRCRRQLSGEFAVLTGIGTPGWSYDHRESELYPPGLPARGLARYAGVFSAAELNSSFCRWAFGFPGAGSGDRLTVFACRSMLRAAFPTAKAVRGRDMGRAHRALLARAGR
jgi:hypothetical protein